MMKGLAIICVVGILLLLVGGTLVLFCLVPHNHWVEDKITFFIDTDFETVRKICVRTNAMERLVEACNGQIVGQQWNGISVGADRLIKPNFVVDASGYFDVKITDQYLGEQVINLKTDAHITPNNMKMTCYLTRPVRELRKCYMVMHMSACGKRTRVDVQTGLGISYRAPKVDKIQATVDASLRQRMRENLVKTEATLRSVIASYADKKFMLRLK